MNEPTTVEEWLVGRHPVVAHLARAFPPGTPIRTPDGSIRYVCSYTEDERLGISRIDPCVDYDRAQQEKEYLCAHHLPGYVPFAAPPEAAP